MIPVADFERNQLALAALIPLALVAVPLFSYWPGLYGEFVLDDFHNLRALLFESEPDSYYDFVSKIFSGIAGPGGRPVSISTFFLHDYAWPTDPFFFKYSNLLLHCLNALLVYIFLFQVTRALGYHHADAAWISLFGAGIWAVHPLNVSTVLYVVQRMTQLAATFSLLSLIVYFELRKNIHVKSFRNKLIWLSSVSLLAVLSFLSKEVGCLVPFYIAVSEIAIFSTIKTSRQDLLLLRAYYCLPIAVLIAYFALNWTDILTVYERRDFTIEQRLWSQARILIEYLGNIFNPQVIGSGLVHDDYEISTGLTQPVSTLFSCILIVSSISLCLIFRKKYKIASFSILLFFSGHLLESTFIGLELYFEHRNYFPMVGPVLLFSHVFFSTFRRFTSFKKTPIFVGISVVLILGVRTNVSAITWGSAERLHLASYAEHPTSLRAITQLYLFFTSRGEIQRSRELIAEALIYHPRDLTALIMNFLTKCYQGTAMERDLTELLKNIPGSRGAFGVDVVMRDQLVASVPEKVGCPLLTLDRVHNVYHLVWDNRNKIFRNSDVMRANVAANWAGVYARQRDLNGFMEKMDDAYQEKQNYGLRLTQAKVLITAGLLEDAQKFVDMAKSDLSRENYFARNLPEREIRKLEALISVLQEKMKGAKQNF